MILVDGGYLKWTYGSNAGRTQLWQDQHRALYNHSLTGAHILLDGQTNYREEYDFGYKAKRRSKRQTDEVWRNRTEAVTNFCERVLKTDPSLKCVQVDGLEADDLIGVFCSLSGLDGRHPLPVMGIDKDLLQLAPHIRLRTLKGEDRTIHSFRDSIPVCLKPVLRRPLDILVYLAVYGDKSDNVSRLVGRGDLRTLQFILSCQNSLWMAHHLYGQAFLENLYLTVLPGPWCFHPVPTPLEVYEALQEGIYPHNLPLRQDLQALYDDLWVEAPTVPSNIQISADPFDDGDDW